METLLERDWSGSDLCGLPTRLLPLKAYIYLPPNEIASCRLAELLLRGGPYSSANISRNKGRIQLKFSRRHTANCE